MLKDILIKTAELTNRDDIITELKSKNKSTPQAIQNDILRLISYYNYTIENLCGNYFSLKETQFITSDKNRKINFLNFTYEPKEIVCVKRNQRNIFFSQYSNHITVPEANVSYEIVYKYIPDPVLNLNDKCVLPLGASKKLVCYGIASEFLASKNNIDQAEYWNNKFMLEIFKTKNLNNRKIKKTFFL